MFQDKEVNPQWIPKYTNRLITTLTQMWSSSSQSSCTITQRDLIFKNRKLPIPLHFKKQSVRCSYSAPLTITVTPTLPLLCRPVPKVSLDSSTLFNPKQGKNILNRWWRASWTIWWPAKSTPDRIILINSLIPTLHNNFSQRIIVQIQLRGDKNPWLWRGTPSRLKEGSSKSKRNYLQ